MKTSRLRAEGLNAAVIVVSAFITALAFHVFIISNDFLPGGITGIAAMTGYLLKYNTGYFGFLFNLPILILVFILVKKSTAAYVFFYITAQSGFLVLLEKVAFPVYHTEQLILAAVAGGVVSGLGFALMLKFFGISGGTYAIGALIQKKNPTLNIVWLSFAMDSLVVLLAFFVYGFNLEAAICTFINLFVANRVSDTILQGFKVGYKYEIVTDKPDEISAGIIEDMGVSVTRMAAEGMYTHEGKSLLVCIVQKRHMGDMQRVLKKYPEAFVMISKINDRIGGRVSRRTTVSNTKTKEE